jgi:hypothetical protein
MDIQINNPAFQNIAQAVYKKTGDVIFTQSVIQTFQSLENGSYQAPWLSE